MGRDDTNDARVLDEALLRLVAQRLGRLTTVEGVSVFPSSKPDSIVARLTPEYYPERVETVTLEVRIYLGGEFSISYREDWDGRSWMCRWDRHDNPHSTRDHFHQPPDARTADAVDRDFPTDFFAVIESVLEYVDDRLGAVWDDVRDS